MWNLLTKPLILSFFKLLLIFQKMVHFIKDQVLHHLGDGFLRYLQHPQVYGAQTYGRV